MVRLKFIFLTLWSLIAASDQIVEALYFTYGYTDLEYLANVLIAFNVRIFSLVPSLWHYHKYSVAF